MGLYVNLWLVLALSDLIFADVPYYVPKITTKPLLGKVTYSGFVIEKPQCIFNQYPSSDVWVVIAQNAIVPKLNRTSLSTPVNSSFLDSQNYYHIFKTLGSDYPCTDTYGNAVDLFMVGSETNCTGISFCNPPLPLLGSYRVKFVVLNNTGLVVESRWSDLISLQTGQNRSLIDTSIKNHSAGMKVITIMLSILLAILTACLIAALVIGSKDVCWYRKLDNLPLVYMEMVRNYYNMHAVYVIHTRYKLMEDAPYAYQEHYK
ncbi:Hypothetical predicted protein [Pelobates cultripes]|uniref:Uncharacterized protein n=1 Tax=Pelobates cultripes TaxID=61616 RepID=A0AAD1R2J8_PELCU|nr:Hypothetical predicted protein [Pelobates cultripes]